VGAASFYYLWVNGPAGTPVITEWFSAVAAGCGAGTGTCGVTPVTGLGGGTHRWWVATWNDISGYGPYSTPLDFTVIPPAGTALIAPSSAISDTTPTYSWTGVYGATYYYLFVRGPSGTAVFSQWYTAAAAGCPDVPQPTFPPPRVATVPTCSVTPTAALTGHGTHRWWVQTWNAVGLGPWSASLTFTLP
jgi:hypothetical protein